MTPKMHTHTYTHMHIHIHIHIRIRIHIHTHTHTYPYTYTFTHTHTHTYTHTHTHTQTWRQTGIKWVVFFQDTNGIIFRALPAVLGVSADKGFAVNSVCVPRTPGEAVGGICRLEYSDGDSKRAYTVNVEYNQLDPLLRSTTEFANGDVADPKTGYSPFPGNINCLVFDVSRYADTLESTKGVVSEFVNPKYADETKTAFKSPTRLECMMQDFPKLLPADALVGFTQLDRCVCMCIHV
jgi:UDP-sugar pyrophosphorylase